MASSNEAQIWGVMAASGSGKGVWLKDILKKKVKPRRMVIWDYKDEYGEFSPGLYRSLEAVRLAMVKAGPRGALVVRFKCKPGTNVKQTKREFEAICRLVQAWGNCTFLAEELSNVTTPSWAPAAWREMTTGGRHERVHIIGVAQNPALIDKTFLSNCTMIHVGPLREFNHRQAVARSMDVPVSDLTALVQFDWIERDYNTRTLKKGRVPTPWLASTPRRSSGSATGGADAGQGAKLGRSIGAVTTTPNVIPNNRGKRK